MKNEYLKQYPVYWNNRILIKEMIMGHDITKITHRINTAIIATTGIHLPVFSTNCMQQIRWMKPVQ